MSHRWDERYRKGDYADAGPEALLTSVVQPLPPGRALDVASGAGRNAIWLAQNGWNVVAVDYSPVALDLLRERSAGLPGIETVQADLEAGEFVVEPDAFDLVCDLCFLWRPLFRPMQDGLRSGGLFVGIYLLDSDAASRRATSMTFLMEPAEALGFFAGWEILHYAETAGQRPRAEIVARKP